MIRLLALFVLLTFSPVICGQSEFPRVMNANILPEEIELDGKLNDTAWKSLPAADNFIVNYPEFGVRSTFGTEVFFAYDDQFVYVGARLTDPVPDSVLSILSQRDDFGNADWFGVMIDPYGSGQNAFGFYVTAAGVELDAIITQDNEDFTWNAVWKSRVALTPEGWSLEMRIPLSQLRFPENSINSWRINFKRQVRRTRELSYWSPVNPQLFSEIAQSGKLEGMKELESPLRLSFSPYTTGYLENSYIDGKQSWNYRQRVGMDVKYGLSESFTLDATLIPDFGQTVSDNLVLNLSPFEVRYAENRPFFLEGMDLFGIGDLFYSRRIGAQVAGIDSKLANIEAGADVTSIPTNAQLLNASKISGRTRRGLGIGVFNAIENKSYIVYRDSLGEEKGILAHPLTNYNVFVLSQNLKNTSNISFINSNVLRAETKALSNVSCLETSLLPKSRNYMLQVSGKMSAIQYNGPAVLGHSLSVNTEKVQGVLTYGMKYYEMSDTYDQNDLGYLERNNFRGITAFGKITGYEPKGRFLRRSVLLSSNLEYLYAPGKYASWYIASNAIGTFRNFLTAGIESSLKPAGEVNHFESRSFGHPVNYPASFMLGGFYSSDYSKPFALDISLYQRQYNARNMYEFDGEISPRIRFSNRLFVVPTCAVSRYENNYGFVAAKDTSFNDQITIGTRDRWIVRNSVSADYIFTNRMGVILRFNHYWQQVEYLQFSELLSSGDKRSSAYTGIDENGNSYHNTSYNAFTVDMSYRWVVYPGSEIRVVWKYNIYASKEGLDQTYFYVFKDLFNQPQLNSFSIRALFFLDAGKLKKRNQESA